MGNLDSSSLVYASETSVLEQPVPRPIPGCNGDKPRRTMSLPGNFIEPEYRKAASKKLLCGSREPI